MPQEDLADRLHSAAIHLLRQVATVDARSGLSPARLSALSVIVYRGPLSMTELARAEQVRPATVTSTVTGLEAAGLVTRQRRDRDNRTVLVEATEAGKDVLAAGRRARLEVLAEGLAALSTEDRAALTRAVDALERLIHRTPC